MAQTNTNDSDDVVVTSSRSPYDVIKIVKSSTNSNADISRYQSVIRRGVTSVVTGLYWLRADSEPGAASLESCPSRETTGSTFTYAHTLTHTHPHPHTQTDMTCTRTLTHSQSNIHSSVHSNTLLPTHTLNPPPPGLLEKGHNLDTLVLIVAICMLVHRLALTISMGGFGQRHAKTGVVISGTTRDPTAGRQDQLE